MPVVSFHFDKMLVEKKKPIEAPLKVDTGMKVTNIEEQDVPISGGKKEKVLKFSYEYSVDYMPKQAEIKILGNLVYFEKKEDLDEIVKEWKKSQKLSSGVMKIVMNNILMRCQIKALLLTQEVGLPPHIRLPSVTPKEEQKKADYTG